MASCLGYLGVSFDPPAQAGLLQPNTSKILKAETTKIIIVLVLH